MTQAAMTKINRIVTVLRENKKTLIPVVRRFAIGCLIGFIAVFLMASMPDNDSSHKQPSRQKFSIANLFKTKDEQLTANTAANNFKYFNDNKMTLSNEQLNAIEDNAPRFTLVLTQFGNNSKIMDLFGEQLPYPVTLGLLSTLDTYNPTASTLKELGYEVWLDVQTISSNPDADNGAMALNPVRDFGYNIELLENQMKDKASTTGLIIQNNSLLTQSNALWEKMSNDIFAQGYGVLDATSSTVPTTVRYYNDGYAPYIKNGITIDTNTSIETLNTQLASIKDTIESEKNVIITTSIYTPAALDIIARWVNSLIANGVVMIPLSAQTNL